VINGDDVISSFCCVIDVILLVILVCSLSLDDTTRLQTLIQILASEWSSDLSDAGHQYAMTHAAGTLQSCSAARELMSGLTQV